MNDEQYWMQRLQAYVQWRSEVGGQRGEVAMRATQENLRSILGRWVRYACNNEIDPATYNELAIGQFCDAQDDIKDTTRADYRRHIRRWCQRLPEFENTRSERMAKLVAEFRETGYPTVKDSEHKRVRMQFEQILKSLPEIGFEERDRVKDVWTTKKDQADFGGAGLGASTLNGTINQASPEKWIEVREVLAELCRGTGEDVDRFDRAMSAPVDGLAELVVTRLLAICHPERFIANYRLRTELRDWPGTLQIAQELAQRGLLDDTGQHEVDEILAIHSKTPVAGAAVVRTHNLIVESLRPYFVEDGVPDTWGMSRFLYWLMDGKLYRWLQVS